MRNVKIALVILVVGASLALGIHNATLYVPRHGFDGVGHVFYIEYVQKHWNMPPPNLDWETHQSPLYYIMGAALMSLFGTWKAAQYLNTFILWLVIGMTGLGLWRVYRDRDKTLIGMLSLAALPMLNIFPAMVTNELLNTLWMISAAVSLLYLVTTRSKKALIISLVWFAASFILGMWTKVSIITIIPTAIIALAIMLVKKSKKLNKKNLALYLLIGGILIAACSYPIFARSRNSKGPSNIVQTASSIRTGRPLDFYFRLDWIPKVDMYNTQYYSMLGGAWNSFWSDGHNAITPFVKFHKKAFILWILGFILLPISLYGLVRLFRKHLSEAYVVYVLGLSMLGMYVLYNLNNHYSAARLTYEMAIVLPYAFGIAGAVSGNKSKVTLTGILLLQFFVMISFFWILPWWAVAK